MCLVYGNKSTDIKTFSGIARCKLNTFQLILDTRGAHLTDKKQTKLDNYKKYNCHHRFVFDTVYMVNHFVKYWPLMLLPYSKRIKNSFYNIGFRTAIVNNRDIVILELLCDLFTIEMDLHDI